MKIKLEICFLIIVIFLFAKDGVSSVFGQDKAKSSPVNTVSDETYEKVFEILFPRSEAAGVYGYSFVLRFKPTFESESQIIIINEAGKIKAIEYKSLSKNIYYGLDEVLQKTGVEDAEMMAKQFQIQRRVINVPLAAAKQWRTEFYKQMALTGDYEKKSIGEDNPESHLMDDGTQYLLWYRGVGEIRFDLQEGGENYPQRKGENPIISWMKQIKQAINKLPSTDKKSLLR